MRLQDIFRADFSLRAVLLGLAGAGFGAAVFFAEPIAEALGVGDGWDADTRAFASRPETLFWLLLICAQTAFWALVAVPAWMLARDLSRWFSRSIVALGILLTALVVAFVVGVGQLRQAEVLEHQALKFGIVTAAGYFAAALPAALSIWAVQRAVDGALSLGGEPRAWLPRFRSYARDELPHQEEPTGIDWFFLMRTREGGGRAGARPPPRARRASAGRPDARARSRGRLGRVLRAAPGPYDAPRPAGGADRVDRAGRRGRRSVHHRRRRQPPRTLSSQSHSRRTL